MNVNTLRPAIGKRRVALLVGLDDAQSEVCAVAVAPEGIAVVRARDAAHAVDQIIASRTDLVIVRKDLPSDSAVLIEDAATAAHARIVRIAPGADEMTIERLVQSAAAIVFG